jgi:hypothetical protein
MSKLTVLALIFVMTFSQIGCGKKDNLIKARGRVVKNGEDFIPAEDENLQVCFIPIQADLSPPRNWYAAEVDPATGTFYAAGGEKKGMPPGKYRVMIELKRNRKDLLRGKFDSNNSPFVFDVDKDSEEMVVDIAYVAPEQPKGD